MKRVMLIGMSLLFSTGVFAQGEKSQRQTRQAPDPKERQEQMLNTMKEELALTDVQAGKIEAIMERRRDEAKKEFEATKEERMERMEALREERRLKMEAMKEKNEAYNQEIKALLSEEQAEKYDQYLQKKREEWRSHRRRPAMKRPRMPRRR